MKKYLITTSLLFLSACDAFRITSPKSLSEREKESKVCFPPTRVDTLTIIVSGAGPIRIVIEQKVCL